MSQRLALDSVVVRDDRLFGWGWFLDDASSATKIFLRIHCMDDRTRELHCPRGGARPDLAEAFPELPHAAGGGFMLQARLPAANEVVAVELCIYLADGRQHVEALSELTRSIQSRESGAAAVVTTQGRWRPWLHLVASGNFREVWRRLRASLARRLTPADSPGGENVAPATTDTWVVFDHAMGGGANHFRGLQVDQWRNAGRRVLVVTPLLASLEYEVSGFGSDADGSRRFPDLGSCLEQLAPCGHIVINDLVSFDDPLRVVDWIMARKAAGAPITYYLHDFHSICPSFTLTASNHRHCGVPPVQACAACLPANDAPFLGMMRVLDVPSWRVTWGRLLAEAEVVAFSAASVDLLARAYPALDLSRIRIQPHSLDYLEPEPTAFQPDLGSMTTIGVVGAISAYKGAGIVCDMAELIAAEGWPARIVVIGTIDCDGRSAGLRVTGPYKQGELAALLSREQVGVAFLPSVVHETFSYVTAELMHQRVPLAVFDLGAPAERVRGYDLGRVIPTIDARTALTELIEFHRSLANGVRTAGSP